MLGTRWSYRTHQAVTTLGFTDDACLVERQRLLVALDPASGDERWRAVVAGEYGSVAASTRHVVHLAHAGLSVFDATTGEMRWRRDLGGIYGWPHLDGDVIVVGGWRAYTDIVAIDADDGTERWTVPGRGRRLHSTRVSERAGALMVADAAAADVVLHDLVDGAELARLAVPGQWADGFLERPYSGDPIVLAVSPTTLAIVDGAARTVRHVAVPPGAWSRNLRVVDSVIPYLTDADELVVHSLHDGEQRVLGPFSHHHRDALPFAPLADGRAAAASSSVASRCSVRTAHGPSRDRSASASSRRSGRSATSSSSAPPAARSSVWTSLRRPQPIAAASASSSARERVTLDRLGSTGPPTNASSTCRGNTCRCRCGSVFPWIS